MAKTRMLKHDLRTSEKVASWPIPIRYFWTLLWGYVDDHGKGKDSPLLVKADCFPLDPDITADVVDEWLWHLTEAQVIERYTVGEHNYLAVIHWGEHQKPPHPTKDVMPAHNDPRAVRRELHASRMKDAGSMPEDFTHGLGWVKSGFGSGFVNESSPAAMERTQPDLDALFDDAYSHWPKKVERKAAAEKFKVAAKRLGADVLVAHIIRFGDAYAVTTEKKFVPALGVWISHERWTDELPAAEGRPPAKQKLTRVEENILFTQQLMAKESETERWAIEE
jgi:hypothetical protein